MNARLFVIYTDDGEIRCAGRQMDEGIAFRFQDVLARFGSANTLLDVFANGSHRVDTSSGTPVVVEKT